MTDSSNSTTPAPINTGPSVGDPNLTEFSSATTFVIPEDAHQYQNISEQFDSDKTRGNGGMSFILDTINIDKDLNLEQIQNYFKSKDEALKDLIHENYSGPTDGSPSKETSSFAAKLENNIKKICNVDISNMVLTSNIKDLKSTINLLSTYKFNKNTQKLSKTERFIELSKILTEK